MKINPNLKSAIESVNLTDFQRRRSATALAIVLLDRIYYAEYDELDWLEIILNNYNYLDKECEPYIANLKALRSAISTLYSTYELKYLQRLGIPNHIRKYEEMFKKMMLTDFLYFSD